MTYRVHRPYFGEFGDVLHVDVPDPSKDTGSLLGQIFLFGSVSVGDVIELPPDYWLVHSSGFRRLDAETLQEYCARNILMRYGKRR